MGIESVPALPAGRLDAYIAACLDRPFRWGSHDCVIFCARWAMARTGRNFFTECGVRQWWKDEEGAKRVLDELGGMVAIVDRCLPRTDPLTAQDGDVALVERSLHLFMGEYIVGPGLNGLEFRDRMDAECAWSTR